MRKTESRPQGQYLKSQYYLLHPELLEITPVPVEPGCEGLDARKVGPCARCGVRHHRYGEGGQPLCRACRAMGDAA